MVIHGAVEAVSFWFSTSSSAVVASVLSSSSSSRSIVGTADDGYGRHRTGHNVSRGTTCSLDLLHIRISTCCTATHCITSQYQRARLQVTTELAPKGKKN